MKRGMICAAALALLAGCAPNAREPDGLALVRVLGVDGAGPVTLTAVCGGAEQESGARGAASAEDFETARQALPWVGEREMALTNLSYIIIGGDGDVERVMRCVMEDRELSPSATVWLAEDAAALLEQMEDPAARLEVLADSGADAPRAVEVLSALKTEGSAELPVLRVRAGTLEVAGRVRWVTGG